ncbi:Ion channel [Phytophthora infestans]|uniref:Ion channel n=1 Tax=Phytophthora infestans TaxID=4787 RepID=A0A833WVJ4_PHYIN|nr:Ion channel [Phytophthora infestans]KAF4135098.1 Ion channel [Phytophthora infestans]
MYMVDPSYDRNKPGFSDLLTTGYFVVVTVATIGYGDITSTKGNVASRCFAVMTILSGTLFLSMPLAIRNRVRSRLEAACRESQEVPATSSRVPVARDYNVVAAFADETIAVWSMNC